MAVKFSEEILLDTLAVRAARSISEIVAPEASNKTQVVSQVIQIAKKALRENNDEVSGAKAAAIMLTEKFCRNGDGQEISKKVFELIKENSKELIDP